MVWSLFKHFYLSNCYNQSNTNTKDHKYTKSCKDFRKNVQCFIKILVKETNFNVSEQLTLILKHSGLLKQRKCWYFANKMIKGHIFAWDPTETGIIPVTASNSVFSY